MVLRQLAEAMATNPEGGTPATDARLLRELAARLIDMDDSWGALVWDALDRALAETSPTARSGALALAEMLRQLE